MRQAGIIAAGGDLRPPPSRQAAGRGPCQCQASRRGAGRAARHQARPGDGRDQPRLLRRHGRARRAAGRRRAAARSRRPHGRARSANHTRRHPPRRERGRRRASPRRRSRDLPGLNPSSRILFDHIAIGVPRMADAAPFLAGELGGIPDSATLPGPFTWGTYRFEGGGSIELIEPLGRSGFVHRFLAERGPGIHHVTFKVPSLDEACARAEAEGYDVVGRDDVRSGMEGGFPPSQAGARHRGPVRSAGPVGRRRRVPPLHRPGWLQPPPPVTLLGLRMRCQSRERAITQWGRVLQGKMADGPRGSLVFHLAGLVHEACRRYRPGPE